MPRRNENAGARTQAPERLPLRWLQPLTPIELARLDVEDGQAKSQ
jgi:hypothetical protein